MNNKRWILLFTAVAFICCGLLAFLHLTDHGNTVMIMQDDSVLYTIDLDQVAEPYELTIHYGAHYNTICVAPGKIYVREADCNNQVCVNHGVLQQTGAPITCLPHHLIISWAKSEVDA